MTSTAQPFTPAAPPLVRRVGNAARLHVANPWPMLIVPWLVFAAIFALTIAVWYVITTAAGGTQNLEPNAFDYNGGVTWVLFFLTAMAVQAINLTFRFALGMGMTRRDYYLGTVAYLTALASMYAAGIAVLAQVERLTNGWGLSGQFFAPGPLRDLPAWQLWYVNAAAGLLFAMLGLAIGAVWVRWRATGLYLFIGMVALLLVAVVWLVTTTGSWESLGAYVGNHSPVVIATWTLPVPALSGVLGYLLLRRATARA